MHQNATWNRGIPAIQTPPYFLAYVYPYAWVFARFHNYPLTCLAAVVANSVLVVFILQIWRLALAPPCAALRFIAFRAAQKLIFGAQGSSQRVSYGNFSEECHTNVAFEECHSKTFTPRIWHQEQECQRTLSYQSVIPSVSYKRLQECHTK